MAPSRDPNAGAGQAPAQKPQYIVNNERQLRDITNEALEALRRSNNPPRLFQRDRKLVRVIETAEGRNVICDVSEAVLRGMLTRSADFRKFKGNGDYKELVECSPGFDVVKDILALPPCEWGFAPLQGVI